MASTPRDARGGGHVRCSRVVPVEPRCVMHCDSGVGVGDALARTPAWAHGSCRCRCARRPRAPMAAWCMRASRTCGARTAVPAMTDSVPGAPATRGRWRALLRRRRRRGAVRLAVVVALQEQQERVCLRQRAGLLVAEVAKLRRCMEDLDGQVEVIDHELAQQRAREHVEALEQHRLALCREIGVLKEQIDVYLDERARLLEREVALVRAEGIGGAQRPATRRAGRRGRWQTR